MKLTASKPNCAKCKQTEKITYATVLAALVQYIAHCRNLRGLGNSIVVFHLFKILRYSNERSTINFRFFAMIEVFGGGNGSSSNITKNREFVGIG